VDLPNLLLVIIDSARRDRCSCYGYGRRTTPVLDHLAAEGVRFAQAYSESSWTVPAMFTLLTGLAPREHLAERMRRLPDGMPALPELLKARGYTTFAVSANPFFGPKCGVQRGFDRFYRPPRAIRVTKPFVKYIAQRFGWTDNGGQAITTEALRRLPNTPLPWFGVVWYFDAHTPYAPRAPYGDRFARERLSLWQRSRLLARLRRPPELAATASPSELERLGDLHDGALAYEDMLLGRLCEALQATGQWEQTVIVVAADHGEMLGERRQIGHGRSVDLCEPVVHVPLVARGPGLPVDHVSEALVQLADIPQALLELAGAQDALPPTGAERVGLLRAARGEGRSIAVSEREPFGERSAKAFQRRNPSFDVTPHICEAAAVVRDGWKLLHRSPGATELYRLADDPQETHDLSAAEPARAAELRQVLACWQGQALVHPTVDGLAADDNAIVEKRLQDLGYF
jgi:arylsulfatase A-like enzyme